MKRKNLVLSAAPAALLVCAAALAQQALEIIALKHRTVEQVLPALRPLLDPGGTVTGQGNQLIVRTSPANFAELQRALEFIDVPARRLQISVRLEDAVEAQSRALAASGSIGQRGSRVEITGQDSRSSGSERVDQRVQVLEGGHAFIATGVSRGLSQRQMIQTPTGVVGQETIVFQELTTGFDVMPRLSGKNVLLDITPRREAPGATPGSSEIQRLATTVTTYLGEWVEIGSSAGSATRDERGIASASRAQEIESRRVWVKVEEIGN
jgi:type II secretory pathway component GspD/PulD (secretin)